MNRLGRAAHWAGNFLDQHLQGLAVAWTLLLTALIVVLIGFGIVAPGCAEDPKPPAKPPLSSEAVTNPLARAGVRDDQIIAAAPPAPILQLATGIKSDLGEASQGLMAMVMAYDTMLTNEHEARQREVGALQKKLDASNSVADQKYHARMRALQFACALLAIGGAGGAMLLTGALLKSVAGSMAVAAGIGFAGISLFEQFETFMDHWGQPILAVALSLLLLIGLYALWAHVKATKKLAGLVPDEAVADLKGVTARLVDRFRNAA